MKQKEADKMDQRKTGISLNELFEVSLPGFENGSEDLSLVICCKKETFEYQYAFLTNNSPETKWLFPQPNKASIYIFPLYVHKINAPKTSNLNPEIINQIAKKLSLHFNDETEYSAQENNSPVCYANSKEVSEDFKMEVYPQSFARIDILDYIYAILNSGKYKQKYQDELKKDFPVVPFPKNQIVFWKMVAFGKKLRKLHLLEGPKVEKYITQFPVEGKNIVNKIHFEENYEIIEGDTIIHISPLYAMGRVYINAIQYFQMVPKFAWELSFGNHQPTQQWLENRKGGILSTEEIMQYQKIIEALFETVRFQNDIDKIPF